jgi:hypothetical protein
LRSKSSPNFFVAAGETIIPARSARISGSAVSGCFRCNVTCVGDVTSTLSMDAMSARMLDRACVRLRSRLNFTASASNGVPSWNFTPDRKSITSVAGVV